MVRSIRGPLLTLLGAAIVALAFLAFVVMAPAFAEPRIALVIGNSDYKGDLPALPNPAKDAKLMAKTLRDVGFEVIDVEDASQTDLKKAIVDFGNRLTAAGRDATGLFYYAGHGVQVNGENYLIPTDAQIAKEADVDLAAVTLSSVQSQMQFADNAVNIIVLDACRDNPLKGSSRGLKRGLAEIKTQANGTFIAYSTAPGETAADGDGSNSPYTKALAETLKEPGLSIGDVFQEVRTKVLAETGNSQRPWDSSSLTGRFYFREPDATQTASLTPPASTVAPPTDAGSSSGVGDLDIEKSYWDSVKGSDDPDDIQSYLAKYPNGYFVDLANARLEQLKGGGAAQVASADTGGTVVRGTDSAADASKVVAPQPVAMSFIAQNQTVYAKGGGQVRAEPSANAAKVAALQTNTEVAATGVSADGKWWRVTLADGRTGYMHRTVVSEQPVQLGSAAPAQQPQQQANAGTNGALGADSFETLAATGPAPAPAQQSSDSGAQIAQGLAQVAQQFGLPGINIPQGTAQPQPTQTASIAFNPINEMINLRQGATIFDSVGGRQIYRLRDSGAMLAVARSSDGRWYQVSLPTGSYGYVARQALLK